MLYFAPSYAKNPTLARILGGYRVRRTITDKIDRVTAAEGRKVEAPPAPISCKIELTSRCNFRCTFCATSMGLRPAGDMNMNFYRDTLLPTLKAAGVQEIGVFFLGESMIRRDLPEFIAEARRQGFNYIFLTTNASLSTPSRVKACMEAGLNSLKFSLNYANVEQFKEIARVKPAIYLKMIENIKAARNVRDSGHYNCGLFASYINYTGTQGDQMRAVVAELTPYLDEIYALPLYSQADIVGEDNAQRGFEVKGGNPGRLEAMRPAVPCWSLFSEARVTWDGRLAACCFDHKGEFEMGDLTKTPFMDAWHSEKFRALRRAHLAGNVGNTPCAGCVTWG